MRANALTGRGQSSVDYALAVGAIAAALFIVSTYVRRALQARYQTFVDGAVESLRTGNQYEPYYPSSRSTVTQDGEVTGSYKPGGIVRSEISDDLPTTSVVEPGSWEQVGVDIKDDDAWQP